jgi:hypothetical protein
MSRPATTKTCGGARTHATLMARARDAGIRRFRAEILPENKTARHFFDGLAPTTRERMSRGNAVITVDLDDALGGHSGGICATSQLHIRTTTTSSVSRWQTTQRQRIQGWPVGRPVRPARHYAQGTCKRMAGWQSK